MPNLTQITTDLSLARLGKPLGFAPLGIDGKVPSINLPSGIAGGLNLQGGYDASTNTPDLTAAPQQVDGHLYIVTVAGTQDIGNGSEVFTVGDSVFYSTGDARWYALQGTVQGIEVVFDNTGTDIIGINVQDAIEELDARARIKLTTDTTFYLDQTLGNDANPGTSAGAGNAWQNLDVALVKLRDEYDLNQFRVTLQLADGTYTPSVGSRFEFDALTGRTYKWFNEWPLTVQGNAGDSTAVVLSSECNRIQGGAIQLLNLTLEGQSANSCAMEAHTFGTFASLVNVNFTETIVGGSTTAVFVNNNADVRIGGTYSITGDIDQFISAEGGGYVIAGGTLTLVDSTAKANFLKATGGAYIYWNGAVVNPENWNGTQLDMKSGAQVVYVNDLPGSGQSLEDDVILNARVRQIEDVLDPTSTDIKEAGTIWYNTQSGNHFISYKSEEFVKTSVNNSGQTHDDPISIPANIPTDLLILSSDLEPGTPLEPANVNITKITFKDVNVLGGFDFFAWYIVPDTNPAGDITGFVDAGAGFLSGGVQDIEIIPNIVLATPTGYKILIDSDDGWSVPAADISAVIYPHVELEYQSNTTTVTTQRWRRLGDKDVLTTAQLYFDSVNGDDAYDGLDPATPVQTQERLQELLNGYEFVDTHVLVDILALDTELRVYGNNITHISDYPLDTFGDDIPYVQFTLPAVLTGTAGVEFLGFDHLFVRGPNAPIELNDTAKLRILNCGRVRVFSDIYLRLITSSRSIEIHHCHDVALERVRIGDLDNPGSDQIVFSNVRRASITNGVLELGSSTILDIGGNSYLIRAEDVQDLSINQNSQLNFLTGRFLRVDNSFLDSNIGDAMFNNVVSITKLINGTINTPTFFNSNNVPTINGVRQRTENLTLTTFEVIEYLPSSLYNVTCNTVGQNRLYIPFDSAWGLRNGAIITVKNDDASTLPLDVFRDTFLGYHWHESTNEETEASNDITYYPMRDFMGTSADLTTANAITGGSVDQVLYQRQRQGDGNYDNNYRDVNGDQYRITFHFAEIDPAITGAGQRLLDIFIEGVQVETALDIYNEAGGNDIALDKSYVYTGDGLTNFDVNSPTGDTVLPAHSVEPLDPIFTLQPGETRTMQLRGNVWIDITPIANSITYSNATSGLVADDVQEAIDELASTNTGLIPTTTSIAFHVETTGNDTTGDGTVGSPFLTPDRAIEEINKYRGTTYSAFYADVVMGDGTFSINNTVVNMGSWEYANLRFLGNGAANTTLNTAGSIDIVVNTDLTCSPANAGIWFKDILLTSSSFKVTGATCILVDTCSIGHAGVGDAMFEFNAYGFNGGIYSSITFKDTTLATGNLTRLVKGRGLIVTFEGSLTDSTTKNINNSFLDLEDSVVVIESTYSKTGSTTTGNKLNVVNTLLRGGTLADLPGDATGTVDALSNVFGVDYDNTTSGLTATSKQAAIDELATTVPITGSPSVLVTADLTFFMDAVGGDDSDDGLTAGTAWQTLQKLTAELRKLTPDLWFEYVITVNFADGTYSTGTTTSDAVPFHIPKGFYIEMNGNGADNTAVVLTGGIQYIGESRFSSDINFYDLTISSLFRADNMVVGFNNCVLSGSATPSVSLANCQGFFSDCSETAGGSSVIIRASDNSLVVLTGSFEALGASTMTAAKFVEVSTNSHIRLSSGFALTGNWAPTTFDLSEGSTINGLQTAGDLQGATVNFDDDSQFGGQPLKVTEQLLTGNKTLTVFENKYHYYTCNSAGITVAFPTNPVNGTTYLVKNDPASTQSFTVGAVSLAPGAIYEVIYTGTQWIEI